MPWDSWSAPPFTGAIVWEDLPSEETPVNAQDLNTAENAPATFAVQVGQSVVNWIETQAPNGMAGLDVSGQLELDQVPSSVVIDPAASTAYTYNPDGTVATATKDGHMDTYAYNADGTLHTITHWYGKTETFSYNADGTVSGSSIA